MSWGAARVVVWRGGGVCYQRSAFSFQLSAFSFQLSALSYFWPLPIASLRPVSFQLRPGVTHVFLAPQRRGARTQAGVEVVELKAES
jgi:hypothetical protein